MLLRVAVRAGDPALEARIAALLNDVGDVSVADDARADVLVIAMTPARALDALRGAAKTILLVDRVDAGWTLEAVRAGARAVLPLEMEAMTLAHALRAVAAGLVVLHPEPLRDEERRTARAFLPENGSLAAPIEPLTLHLLAEGLSNKAIARRLAISDHTVKFHLAAIFSKLDAKSRAEALAQAIRFGLVHL
jgi:DNA-binding NarL/FixJ family response regulator